MTDLVFIQDYAPHGTIKGQEVLDACLMGSAFATCGLVFRGDGLYQILKHQKTDALGVKNYAISYGVLKDYGVQRVMCLQADMDTRNLRLEDFEIDVEALTTTQFGVVLAEAKQVLTF